MTKYTDSQLELLDKLVAANPDLTVDQALPFFEGHPASSLDRMIRDAKNPTLDRKGRKRRFPLSLRERFKQDIHLAGNGDLAVFSDVHAPCQDADFMNRVMDLAVAWGVNRAYFNGDLLNFDYFSTFPKSPTDLLEDEMEAGEETLGAAADHFAEVIWAMGNHEYRLIVKAMNHQLPAERWSKMLGLEENVRITHQPYITMDSPIGPWVLGHPEEASQIPAKVPQEIAHIWPGYHIAGGHGHLWGIALDKSGQFYALDIGMAGDPARIGYAQRFSKRPRMCQGALLLKGGRPYLLRPDSDFAALRKMYAE